MKISKRKREPKARVMPSQGQSIGADAYGL